MIKTKKQMLIVIMSFVLIILLGTTTYAFFNYTKTGLDNTLRVGRINFISRQEQTISLTNAFPIDPDEEGIMDDDTKVGTLEIEIEGDTDYSDGVEYLISTTNTNVYTNEGNTVPISIDVTVDGLGTSNDNYFTARNSKNANIYKRLTGDVITGNQMLLVGYIKPNTTPGTAEGVNGSVTIKAYLDENRIAITDTYKLLSVYAFVEVLILISCFPLTIQVYMLHIANATNTINIINPMIFAIFFFIFTIIPFLRHKSVWKRIKF